MERLVNFIPNKLKARRDRLEGLYAELGQAPETPGFTDLVDRRKKLIGTHDWLEDRFDTAEDYLDTKKGLVNFLLSLALSAAGEIAEITADKIFPIAERHLGAVYGRRINRSVRQLEKSLKRS